MFKQGERVKWTGLTGIPAGSGRVCGVAITEQLILGRGYIIEFDTPIPSYRYTHGLVFEVHLTKVVADNQ